MRRLVCFDVNETLLDWSVLDACFEPFGGWTARQVWFSQLLVSAMASTLAGRYQDFSALAREALKITAARHDWSLTDAQVRTLFAKLAEAPAHPDAIVAIDRLRQSGFQVAALTNSAPAAVRAQLERSGLASRFDAILSVETVSRYKPAPEPYRMAAAHFGLRPAEMWMVAAHDWDVLGAMAAGCMGLFVARGRARFPDGWPRPTLQERSLAAAASAIIRFEKDGRAS